MNKELKIKKIEFRKMNNERCNQIIDEAYENYQNYPLATIHDHRTNLLYKNSHKGWCMLNGRSMVSPHPTRHLTKEEFIDKCKTDLDFTKRWGLKIEERELSLEERGEWDSKKDNVRNTWGQAIQTFTSKEVRTWLNEKNVPTKLLTITYNNETIEVYE
jgi:hypothetical protein